jgi:quercetin dioxygenase-like cupin family protein
MAFFKKSDQHFVRLGTDRSRTEVHTGKLMIVLFDFEGGPWDKPDPPHSHPHEQISYIASGRVRYFIDAELAEAKAGDLVTVPPGIPHSIQLLSEEARLVDAFHPLREDFIY